MWNVGQTMFKFKCFVVTPLLGTISSTDQTYPDVFASEVSGDPNDHWGFTCAARGQIANRDNGDAGFFYDLGVFIFDRFVKSSISNPDCDSIDWCQTAEPHSDYPSEYSGLTSADDFKKIGLV